MLNFVSNGHNLSTPPDDCTSAGPPFAACKAITHIIMLAGLRTVQAFVPVGVRNFHSVRSSAVPRAQRFCRQSARAMASDEAAAAKAAVKAGCALASRGEGHTT